MSRLVRNQVIVGDVRQVLARLPEQTVDCVVTSPPYFRLRDYQTPAQIGLEESVDGWVDELRLVACGLARVLKPNGSLWLNLGDTYARHERDGAMPKSLLLGPERLALAMLSEGWTLRNKIVWSKPNPMPSPVRDRLSCTHEIIYCFVRSRSYYYDLDAIRVPHRSARRTTIKRAVSQAKAAWSVPTSGGHRSPATTGGLDRLKASGRPGHPLGKSPGDVWIIPTAGYRGAHHAVYPEALVERLLRVGCPERVCGKCGQPWRRQPCRTNGTAAVAGDQVASCTHQASWRPGLVLDPFLGSGTTAVVADRLRRHWVGIEVNPDFAALAESRIASARAVNQARAA